MRPGYAPGAYPSGGPLPHLFDVWRTGAPSLDFLAPDIYFPNFVAWVDRYARPGNPLFIPEAGRAGAPDGPANAFYAFAERNALGFSPFSIESIDNPADSDLARCYELLRQLAPLLLANQGRGTLRGFRPPVNFDGVADTANQAFTLGDYQFTVDFTDPWIDTGQQTPEHHGGLVMQLGPGDFLVAGTGITLTFAPADGEGEAGILAVDEGRFEDGEWQAGRRLNGDQTHQGRHLRIAAGTFGIQRLSLYRYK